MLFNVFIRKASKTPESFHLYLPTSVALQPNGVFMSGSKFKQKKNCRPCVCNFINFTYPKRILPSPEYLTIPWWSVGKLMQWIRELEGDGSKDMVAVLQWVLSREIGAVTRNETLLLNSAEGACLCFQKPLDIRQK